MNDNLKGTLGNSNQIHHLIRRKTMPLQIVGLTITISTALLLVRLQPVKSPVQMDKGPPKDIVLPLFEVNTGIIGQDQKRLLNWAQWLQYFRIFVQSCSEVIV